MDEETNKQTTIKLQPKWKNAPGYSDFKNDLDSASGAQDAYKALLIIWNEIRDGGPVPTKRIGQSTARPKLVRKQNEWKYAALEEPFLNTRDMFGVSPRTFEDVESAKQNGIVLNYQWSTKIDKTKLVGDIVRTVVDEGTVIVKTGWEAEIGYKTVEEEEPVYASPEESLQLMEQAVAEGTMNPAEAQARLEMGEPMQTGTKKVYIERETLIRNHPTYEVCNNANVIIDPTCEGIIANAKFVIHEFDTDYATLKSDEFEVDKDGNESGIYYNIEGLEDEEDSTEHVHESASKRGFKYKDKARKLLRAYEYWGYWDIQGNGELVSIIATWVGQTLIRLEENPFPHKRIPFSVSTYMPVKKEIHGEPDAELLGDNQDSIGKMQRAIHDITAKAAVGQEFIDENLFPSPSQKNNYEKGNTVYVRSGFDVGRAIHREKVEQVPSAVFDVINYQTLDAENITGTRAFGQTNSTTATGVRSSTDAASKREQSILRRLADLLFKDMARMTISMNQAFLSEEEIVRVTNKKFVTIRRDDLSGDFDLRIDVSTPEKDDDKAQKLMTLLQTNQANMSLDLQKIFYTQLLDLWKLPDASETIAQFEPEKDPKQEALVDMQIENQRLINEKLKMDMLEAESRMNERNTRAEENLSADIGLKQSKADEMRAKAEKLRSEADVIDQQFLDVDSGSKRAREIEDAEFNSLDKAEADIRKQSKRTN